VTPREEFHQFIDELNDDLVNLAKPDLHRAIDELEDAWVRPALKRMRNLRAGLDSERPETRIHWSERGVD
jgi:hypothetical protein